MSTKSSYQRRLKKHANVRVRCPACQEETTFEEFISQHAQVRHGLNKRYSCIFCLGSFSFQRGSGNTIKHRIECMDRFIATNRVKVIVIPEPPTQPLVSICEARCSHHSVSICEACCSFHSVPRTDYRSTPTTETVGLSDPVYETNDTLDLMGGEGGVEFDEQSGLGKRVYFIVQRFLRGDLDWYHIMVKHDAFETFVRVMRPIQNDFVILPYWCLCDGLKDKNGCKVIHRHMILACVKSSSFREVWVQKVRYDDGEKGRKAKKLVCIQTCDHLIDTIVYLSTRKGKCDRGISDDTNKTLSHFFLNIPLHKHAIWFLATLYPGGVENKLRQRLKLKSVVDWVDYVVKRRGKWQVPIHKTNWKSLHCVIPVAKQYEPTLNPTEAVFTLYLFDNLPLHFKRNEALDIMSRHQWYEHQMSLGNTFHAIGEKYLVLARNQQGVMNQLKKLETQVQQRIGELEQNLDLMTQERNILNQKLFQLTNSQN